MPKTSVYKLNYADICGLTALCYYKTKPHPSILYKLEKQGLLRVLPTSDVVVCSEALRILAFIKAFEMHWAGSY